MPFSFKPEISQEATQDGAQQAPASFGSSVQDLMARGKEEGGSVVQVLLMVVAGLAALASAVLFGYKFYLSSQIENKKASLDSYEAQLAALPLEDMRKLSNRMKLINQLVKEHPSVNVAFKILEDSIENPVTYTRFDLRYVESLRSYQLQLKAISPNYRAIVQQVDTYKRKPYTNYISSVTVEGLSPNDEGSIDFTLKMPIMITGLLPEQLNLSEGAAERVAASLENSTGTTTPNVATSTSQSAGPSLQQ